MKNLILSVFLILGATVAKASEINCVLQEELNGETSTQSVALPATDDPHGALSQFQLIKYPDYSGFVALSKGFTVINLVNNKTDVGISSQSKAAGDSFARLQVILGFHDSIFDMIVIQCGEPN